MHLSIFATWTGGRGADRKCSNSAAQAHEAWGVEEWGVPGGGGGIEVWGVGERGVGSWELGVGIREWAVESAEWGQGRGGCEVGSGERRVGSGRWRVGGMGSGVHRAPNDLLHTR